MQDSDTLPFRKFKIAKTPVSAFTSGNSIKNKEWADEDLGKSGLDTDFLFVDSGGSLRLFPNCSAGYQIPYFGPDGLPLQDSSGLPVMFRVRMKLPPMSKERRYDQPSAEQLGKFGLPAFMPYIHPLSLELEGELVCAEGEKKAASIMRILGLPAIGIGGCQLWRNPDGSGTVHPWILELLRRRGGDSITIVPDGDVMRYDICKAYGAFGRALEGAGIKVRILKPEDKIDDMLVRWGTEAALRYPAIPAIDVGDLVQSPSSLIPRYGLAFRDGPKGEKIVYQHTSNIMRLLEEHPAFPKLWRNLDSNRVMVGEEEAEPGLTEMDIANYFQHNLGFDRVQSKTIYSCVDALAKRNSRSPYLDWVRSLEWDGEERLDSWPIRLWGTSDSEYVREIASKFLISACARLEKPGTKLDWMLIVVGPQGTGKTSMPSILFGGQNLTLYGEHSDKDLHLLMHSSLCVGFDELDSFGKRESSNLKAMITRNEDAFRPPYGASVEVFPRRFTLYGCGNRYEFLQHDPSGYRRYAVIETPKLLDFPGLERERAQLWAEAWSRYSEGDSEFWEIKHASEMAEKYAVTNPLEERIQEFLGLRKTGTETEVRFRMIDLLSYLDIRAGTASVQVREIAGILRGLGIKKPETNTRHPGTGMQGKWYIHAT